MASALPKTMKTLLQASRSSTEVIITTAPVPVLSDPRDVLVKVYATAPCAGELNWAIDFPDAVPMDKVMVPCQDLAGTVVEAPEGSGFAPGDRVFCRISAERAGAAREYATARVSELAKMPEGLDWINGAAIPLSALTAWQALFVQGGLDAAGINGDAAAREKNSKLRVLVTGAAGGVGSWGVQLAALAGAGAVVAVCSPGKVETVRGLGATEIVDYTKTSLAEWVAEDASRQCDLVFDCNGKDTLAGCWHAVRDGGELVSICAPPEMFKPEGVEKPQAKVLFFIVDPSGKNLEEIAGLVAAGRVVPLVDSVWEFEQFEQAFAKLESGHAKGKIIIKVSE